MKKITLLPFVLLLLLTDKSTAQKPGILVYDQHEAFSPLPYINAGNPTTRSINGSPGKAYWQNRADYTIRAKLDTLAHTLTGTVEITYHNNSPDELPYLWLQLEQDIFRDSSRAVLTSKMKGSYFADGVFEGGYNISSVKVRPDSGGYAPAEYLINDTRMQVRPAHPLRSGEKMTLQISYSFAIPGNRSIRMARMPTPHGQMYQVAQWYPRMCVYDDLTGWNTLPYQVTGEFYLEYGDFDVMLEVPAGMLVVASGELMNPEKVLSEEERSRLAKARGSDTAITVRTIGEVKKLNEPKGYKQWHFRIRQARDMVWAASKAFVWDAARINLPSGGQALAQSVYPIESAGKDGWGRSTEFIKGVIEYYSNEWFPYPYPNAIHVAGKLNGMEYPGMVFSNTKLSGADLFSIVNHEFGHFIFPIVVGSNERKHKWMDEGLNTFLNILCADYFNDGEFRLPAAVFNLHEAAKSVFNESSEPILTLPEVLQRGNIERGQYGKPAVALMLLRDHILGKHRFDYAFKQYIAQWAYKHPEPADFFRSMDNAGGEELGWFWKGWFIHNWKLDQAVTNVECVTDDPSQGCIITIANLDKMVMPAIVEISEANGTKKRITLPAEIWQRGNTWTFRCSSASPIERVVLDPDKLFPDMNPANNTFTVINR